MRAARLALVVLLAVACSPTIKNPFVVQKETITLDHKRFRDSYEHVKTVYLRARPAVQRLCATGCLTPEQCKSAAAIDEGFKRLDLEAQTVLRNPDVEPNWEVIAKMVSALVGFVL